jgi:2,3,4,5-tetrahydropyridine-2-carboxylate N-succinyltransferase
LALGRWAFNANRLRRATEEGEIAFWMARAVVGEDAVLGPGCHLSPDCGVGTGAELGPGVVLHDRTRLPGKQSPTMVGAGAKIGAGAVVAGVKVGEGAVVAAGEVVEDDVPDGAVWMGGRVAGQF